MTIYYIAILFLALFGVRYCHNGIHKDYLDKTQCQAINGIFIMVVFLRHIHPYIHSKHSFTSLLDQYFLIIDNNIGQLLVVTFLFYSGFGIAESIKNKGSVYINKFPQRRLLSTLLNFDIAILCFLLLNILLGIKMSATQIGLSFIGWDSIGNSNWYIFVILLCYIISYVAYVMNSKLYILIVTVLTFISVLLLFYVKPTWWYDTMLCYPMGMIWSKFKSILDNYIENNYFIIFALIILTFIVLHISPLLYLHGLTSNAKSIIFAIIVLLLTMKIRIRNKYLIWMGAHLFPLYIYQRLPMIALSNYNKGEWISSNLHLYVIISFATTCLIAYNYHYWHIKLN